MGKKRTDFNDFPDMIRENEYEKAKEEFYEYTKSRFCFRVFRNLLEKLRKKGGKKWQKSNW